jgi:hypothetical protein
MPVFYEYEMGEGGGGVSVSVSVLLLCVQRITIERIFVYSFVELSLYYLIVSTFFLTS